MMEDIKKTYLESYTERVGEETIEKMRKTIQAEEKNIRASYNESTKWIPSEYFVELILQDSVFIMEFFLKEHNKTYLDKRKVFLDLMLLENQLPYFILDRLFSSTMNRFIGDKTFDQFIVESLRLSIKKKTNFKHFTDIYWCVYEESFDVKEFDDIEKSDSLDIAPKRWVHMLWEPITQLRNADCLSQAGVTFQGETYNNILMGTKYSKPSDGFDFQKYKGFTIDAMLSEFVKQQREIVEPCSLNVVFKKGCLKMPIFHVDETCDMRLRNVIAYEQCHVAVTPMTSNYILFLNFLITSDRDVQLLTEAGAIMNTMGRPSLVIDMVNKLQVGLRQGDPSQYTFIVSGLEAHYKSRRKMCWATLNRVYFSDMLTGTATLGAVLLLFLTLVGTIASVLQAYKSFK